MPVFSHPYPLDNSRSVSSAASYHLPLCEENINWWMRYQGFIPALALGWIQQICDHLVFPTGHGLYAHHQVPYMEINICQWALIYHNTKQHH